MRPYHLLLALLLGLATGCAALRGPEATAEATPSPTHLSLEAPASTTVGRPLTLTATTNAADGATVQLGWLGSYGLRWYTATVANGRARFDIPAADTQETGYITLIAQTATLESRTTLQLQPDMPVEPLTPLVGTHSITADGRSWSITVIVPFDQFGNPIAEDTPVHIQARHPGDNLENFERPIDHLLAWARIHSSTRAGRTAIAVQTGNAHGSEGKLLEVPGWPVPFGLDHDPKGITADGQQLTYLRTDRIVDKFGNVLPDGTLVNFLVTDPRGTSSIIPATILDGRAKAPLQAPTEPVTLTVEAVVFGITSQPMAVAFTPGPALGRFPLTLSLADEGLALRLEAGPLLGSLGQYVPDGTEVTFTIQSDSGAWVQTAVAESGYAALELRLAELEHGRYTVEAHTGIARAIKRFVIK